VQQEKHGRWTIWTIFCFPCNRVNKYLEDLVNEAVVDEEEIESCEYSSGESEPDEANKI